MSENTEALISALCGNNINTKNYSLCNGLLFDKCRFDQHCDLLHLTNNQVTYILSNMKADIYLNACPGSGKTEVVAIKCAFEMLRWKSKASGMAVLTFTNSAEDEIRERTVSYLRHQIQYPHFLGTFTSWLHGYVANPFLSFVVKGRSSLSDAKLKIVDSSCRSEFLSAFKTKYTYGNLRHIPANHFFYNIKSQKYCYCGSNEIAEKKEFLEKCTQDIDCIKKDLRETKKRFRENGFCTYEDVEYLTYYLLKKHTDVATLIARRFPFIVIDECQDLSYVQLSILSELHKAGTKIHLVGDLNQAIYGFRDIEPTDTENFIKENSFQEMLLSENFRSNQAIVDVSGRVVNRKEIVAGKKKQKVKNPLVAFLYKSGHEEKLLQVYQKLLIQEKLSLQECRIIVRNTNLKRKLLGIKYDNSQRSPNGIEDFAHFVYLQKSAEVTSFQDSIQYLGRAVHRAYFINEEHSSAEDLYRPICFDSTTWRSILMNIKNALVADADVLDLDQTWGEWKVKLSHALAAVSDDNVCELALGRLRNGVKRQKVITSFDQKIKAMQNCGIELETIHSCKGRGYDAILFVSSPRQNNTSASYWKNWFPRCEHGTTEATRLSYVAFSRAKQLLTLGIPNSTSSPLDNMDLKLLQSYGFKIYDCSTDAWLEE